MLKSVYLEIINYLLNNEKYECCICNEEADKYYIICKPECLNYSYCKECMNKIKEKKICPFTKKKFKEKDVCLDMRINNAIENKKQLFKKTKEYLGNSIKRININIET